MYGRPYCAYAPLDLIGFDVNFNKFKNHGLELRIFDWFDESELDGLMRLLVWILDAAQELEDLEPPQKNATWNAVAERCVWEGGSALLSAHDIDVFRKATGILFLVPEASGTLGALTAYERIWQCLCQKLNGTTATNLCARKMIRNQLLVPRAVWPHMSFMSVEEASLTRENYRDIVRVTLKRRITVSSSKKDRPIQAYAEREIHPHQIQCLPLYRSVTPRRQQRRQGDVQQQEAEQGKKGGLISRLVKKLF